MQKTKLGIGIGLMGALVCLAGYYNGLLALILLGGYLFLKEEDEWLKKLCVRAIATVLAFSVMSTVLSLVPDVLGVLADMLGWVGIALKTSAINNIIYFLQSVLQLLEKVVFLMLGLKALKQQTIKIPVVDNMVDKFMA